MQDFKFYVSMVKSNHTSRTKKKKKKKKEITILKTELHFNQKKRPGHASPTTQLYYAN